MLSIFRKIRRVLVSQNAVLRYLYYALGEILLIVIGILIALQLNNWNQARKASVEESIILQSLHADLVSAQTQSQRAITNETHALHLLETALKSKAERTKLLADTNLDMVLYQLFWNFEVDVPVINTYTELKSSGKKERIQSAEIRKRFTNIEMGINNLTTLVNDRAQVQQLRVDDVVVNHLNFVRLLKSDSPNLDMELGEKNDFDEIVNDPTNRNLIAMKFELTQSVNNFRLQLSQDMQVLMDLIEKEITDTLE